MCNEQNSSIMLLKISTIALKNVTAASSGKKIIYTLYVDIVTYIYIFHRDFFS